MSHQCTLQLPTTSIPTSGIPSPLIITSDTEELLNTSFLKSPFLIPSKSVSPRPPNSPSSPFGLDCVICRKSCASPIYGCTLNGHLTCGLCHDKEKDKINPKCSLCQSPLIVNVLAENLSRQWDLKIACPFSMSGCKNLLKTTGVKEHIAVCEYRDIRCFYRVIGNKNKPECENPIPMVYFANHFKTTHPHKKFYNDIKGACDIPFIINKYSENSTESQHYWGRNPAFQYAPVLIAFDGMIFAVHATLGLYTWHWWVTILGGKEDAQKYNYLTRLKVSPNAAKCNIGTNKAMHDILYRKKSMPMLTFHQDKYFDAYSGMYATESAAKVGQFYTFLAGDDKEDAEVHVSIELVKIKSADIMNNNLNHDNTNCNCKSHPK